MLWWWWWWCNKVVTVGARPAGTGWALPTIPSIPISWEDAKPLFEALGGPLASTMTADGSWVGGIDTTYNVGPGATAAWCCVSL